MYLLGKIIVLQYLNQSERAELLEESLCVSAGSGERTLVPSVYSVYSLQVWVLV